MLIILARSLIGKSSTHLNKILCSFKQLRNSIEKLSALTCSLCAKIVSYTTLVVSPDVSIKPGSGSCLAPYQRLPQLTPISETNMAPLYRILDHLTNQNRHVTCDKSTRLVCQTKCKGQGNK